MNKKADQNLIAGHTVAGFLMIVAVLFGIVLLIIYGRPLYTKILGLGEDKQEQIINPEEIENQLNILATRYDKCFNSKSTGCVCDIQEFPSFPTEHYLLIEGNKIKLYDKNDRLVSEREIKIDIGCITTSTNNLYSPQKIKQIYVYFDKSEIYIKRDNNKQSDLYNKETPLFKHEDNSICFVTKDGLGIKFYNSLFKNDAQKDFENKITACS